VRLTYEAVKDAVDNCSSMRQVLNHLGYAVSGASTKMVRKKIEDFGLVEPKWGSRSNRRKELDEILIENSTYISSGNLKRRLIKEGLLKNECKICKISEWLGKPITLQLDHENGIHDDNRLSNLRILCPNCHTQTETWGGKKRQ
jgi:hypothetical protein